MKRFGYALLGLLMALTGCAGSGPPLRSEAGFRVAIMPFADYSGNGTAGKLLAPRLTAGLEQAGLSVATEEDLRPVLRKYRIRSQGMIGRKDAGILAAELGLDFLVMGSWDVCGTGQNPELGFSVRILATRSMALIKAVSVDQTGADSRGLLDIGGVDSLTVLADMTVTEALDAILPLSLDGPEAGNNPLVAVVALDNLTQKEHSGAICSSILVSRLMAGGYPVLEPGFLREMQLDLETGFRGGIDRANLHALEDRYPVGMVITGTVDVFDPAVGDPEMTVPRVALGLRVISPVTGRVVMTREISATGGDHDGWFLRGRIHGVTDLAFRALEGFMKDLNKTTIIREESGTP